MHSNRKYSKTEQVIHSRRNQQSLLVYDTWTFLIFINSICSGYLSFLKLKSKITFLKWWYHLLWRGTLSQEKNLPSAKDAFWSRYRGKGFNYTNSVGVWNLSESWQLIVWYWKRKTFFSWNIFHYLSISFTLSILPNKVPWKKKTSTKIRQHLAFFRSFCMGST